MANIKFTADSTCDLSDELIKKLDVEILHFFVSLGDKGYRDGVDIFPETIFDFVEKNKILPKTAAPSPEEYAQLFSRYSKDFDAVIHFNISNELSASNQNANVAMQQFDNVYVINSLSLSTGTSILIMKADELRQKGMEAEEIVKEINGLRHKVQASFVVDTLEYLHKGGRCSALARLGATILKLHPMLLLKDGKITVFKKLRGKIKSVYMEYLEILKKEFPSPENEFAFLTMVAIDEKTAEIIKKKVKELYNFKEVYVTAAGCTITSHCGKGTFGLLFLNK
jgi:DegV family protein with EDD domain